MELEINGAKLRVYEDGKIERWHTHNSNQLLKIPKWKEILQKSLRHNKQKTYFHYSVCINYKTYNKSRLVYKAFNPEWDINDSKSIIDHIDGNPLNNYLNNLRVVSHQQNCWNNHKARGYWFDKQRQHWRSEITTNGKGKYLGSFKTEQEARQAYLDAVALRPSC